MQLLGPGWWDLPATSSDDDAVVGRVLREALSAVTRNHFDLLVTDSVEARSRRCSDLGIDVDGGHGPLRSNEFGQKGRVVARARPDFEDVLAGLNIEPVQHPRHERRL